MPHPSANADYGYTPVTSSNGYITLLTKDKVVACGTGNCDEQIVTELYVNLDRDCDGFIDDNDGAITNPDPARSDLTLIDTGGAGRIPLRNSTNDPYICFYAEALKPDFTIPIWSGPLQARITAPAGSSGDKTVNFKIVGSTVGDMGDLPDEGVVSSQAGYNYGVAGHLVAKGDPFLGTAPDTETTYFASIDALGDDTNGNPPRDDEDGVTLPTSSITDGDGNPDVYTTTVNATNNSGKAAILCAWMDLDHSGDFNNAPNTSTTSADPESASATDTGERSCISVPDGTTGGSFPVAWTLPGVADGGVAAGTFYFRYRITTDSDFSDPNLLSPDGIVDSGEVEDYTQDITSLPVTLSRFKAQLTGNGVDFNWGTASETSTVGFNLWGKVNGQWQKLNEYLVINHTTDSVTPQSYNQSVTAPAGGQLEKVAISSVDTDGTQNFFGPFELGAQYGVASTPDPIPWQSIQTQLDNNLKGKGYVRKGGKWRKSDHKKGQVSAAATAASGTPAVDLETGQEGIYRVTYSQLLGAGVDFTGVATGDIALTHKGQPVSRFVHSGSGFGPGGYIDFYAEPVDSEDARYTDTNVYRVRVNPGLAVDSESLNQTGKPGTAPTYYMETAKRDVNVEYGLNMPSTNPWYEQRLIGIPGGPTGQASVDLTLDHLATGAADSRTAIHLGLDGITYFGGSTPDHEVKVYLNGGTDPVADVANDGIVAWDVTVPVAAGALHDGSNTVRVEVPGVAGYPFDLLYGDTYAITYPRAFMARDDVLDFKDNGDVFEVNGFSTNDLVAYASSNGTLTQLKVKSGRSNGAFSARIPGVAGADARYWVSTQQALLSPEVVNPGQPADLLDPSADYIIVSHANFIDRLNEAQDFISAKQNQGYSVKIVDVEDIFEQYGYGLPVPGAIRAYLQAQDAVHPIRQVLLVGGATSDPLNYTGAGSIDFVPTYFARTSEVVFQTPADGLIADLYGASGPGSDPDGIPDKSIGRWPVRTLAELDSMISKTLQYQQTMASQHKALLAAGARDTRFPSFAGQVDRVAGKLVTADGQPWSDLTKVYVDDFSTPSAARDALLQGFNDGNAVTLFSGHGSPTSWTFQNLLNSETAKNLSNADKPTLVGTMSCYTSYFVSPSVDTLGNALLLSGNRGAALVQGAATLSGFSDNEAMLGRAMSAMSQGTSAGEAVLQARQALGPDFRGVITNWAVLGDPSLHLTP